MLNRSVLHPVLALLSGTALLACATIFSPGPDPVDFGSQPEGAQVIVNGQNMGSTPVTLRLRPEKQYTITFRKEGFQDATVTLSSHVQAGWVVLDIFAGLLGVAIDAATGKWKAFDEGQYFVELNPEGSK